MSESTPGGTDQNQTGEAAVDIVKLQETLNAAIAERDTLKTQLRDLSSASKGTKDLQKQYDELLTKHSKLNEDFEGYKGTVKQKAIDSHVQTALDASGAHNAARVKAMLDMSKVKIADDGTVDHESLAAVIKALKESDPYMFKEQQGNGEGQMNSGTTTTKQLPGVSTAAADKSGDAFKLALEAAKKSKDPFKAIEEVTEKYRSGAFTR